MMETTRQEAVDEKTDTPAFPSTEREYEENPWDDEIIVAEGVSEEEYMEKYAEYFCEYVEGRVIDVAASELKHNKHIHYLYYFLESYFELRPIGQVIGQPFVMRNPAFPKRRREPDLLVVLDTNPHKLYPTYLDGPADVCIEIVSKTSSKRDYGAKFIEYEAGGVGEYWIIDPTRKEHRFFRLQNGQYATQMLDQNRYYRPAALPDLVIDTELFWSEKLPGPIQVSDMIRAMLGE